MGGLGDANRTLRSYEFPFTDRCVGQKIHLERAGSRDLLKKSTAGCARYRSRAEKVMARRTKIRKRFQNIVAGFSI